jgi:hypothetical protein
MEIIKCECVQRECFVVKERKKINSKKMEKTTCVWNE